MPERAFEIPSDAALAFPSNKGGTDQKMRKAATSLAARDYAAAETLFLEVAAEAQKKGSPDKAKAIVALECASGSATLKGDMAAAMLHMTAASGLTNKKTGPVEWADVNQLLAYALQLAGDYTRAEALYREVVAVRTEKLGATDQKTLQSRSGLALVMDLQGLYDEAVTALREVIKSQEHLLGPEEPDVLGSRCRLALALCDQGKPVEAETECRDLIGIDVRIFGPESAETLGSRMMLGDRAAGGTQVCGRRSGVSGDHPDSGAHDRDGFPDRSQNPP